MSYPKNHMTSFTLIQLIVDRRPVRLRKARGSSAGRPFESCRHCFHEINFSLALFCWKTCCYINVVNAAGSRKALTSLCGLASSHTWPIEGQERRRKTRVGAAAAVRWMATASTAAVCAAPRAAARLLLRQRCRFRP